VNGTESKRGGRPSVRNSLRDVVLAWVFGAMWLHVSTGAVVTRFAKQLHMTEFGYGLMAAIPYACALIQLPASYLIERFGHHKSVFITAGILHRGTWIAMAAVPWLVDQAWWWPAFLWLLFVSFAFSHVATPVWFAWMSALVPARIRGRYFSRRNQIGQFVGLGVTLLTGWLMDQATPRGADAVLKTVAVILGVGGVMGMLDFILFLPVPPPPHRDEDPLSFLQLCREPLRNRNFRRFLWFTGVLTFGMGYIAPFVWLYMFDEVGLTNTQANLLITIIPLIITMSCLPLWGRLVDRFGRKSILVVTTLFVINGATAWLFVQRGNWWPGYLVVFMATIAWPGLDLAIFNVLLDLNEEGRARRCGMAYSALHSVTVACCGMLSGLFGGQLAHWLADWRTVLWGIPLSYHAVLFGVSALIRFIALFFVLRLEDEPRAAPRVAVRQSWSSALWNFPQTLLALGRQVIRTGILSYRLGRKR